MTRETSQGITETTTCPGTQPPTQNSQPEKTAEILQQEARRMPQTLHQVGVSPLSPTPESFERESAKGSTSGAAYAQLEGILASAL